MEYLDLFLKVIGASTIVIAVYQYRRTRQLDALNKFITYREKLKDNESIVKIVRHIQDCESDSSLRSQILERGITKYDFYYFLGFFEEISILYKSNFIKKNFVKEMFAYYALQVADNAYYWSIFDEDYKTDKEWGNFRYFVNEMR